MPLDITLGSAELRLFSFPEGEIEKTLKEYAVASSPPFLRDLLAANVAELAAFAAQKKESSGPYIVQPGSTSYVVHKTNTLTYTCGIHSGKGQFRPEYIFLFTSDCWKLREILKGEPDKPLLSDPKQVLDAVLAASWRFSTSPTVDADLRVTVLLWAIKARLLNKLDETKVEWKPIVRQLTEALGIELASSGYASAH
jgi:hypothetical protein